MDSRQPGSIAETVRRLALWAARAPKGLALVTYVSDSARRQATESLAGKLTSAGIPHRQIRLPAGLSAAELAREFDRLLGEEPGTVTSVLGWAEAFDAERRQDRLDALRFLGAHRERLVKPGLLQIWWMPPDLAESLAFATPDLESWIMVQLELAKPSESPRIPMLRMDGISFDEGTSIKGSKPYLSLADARRRSAALAARYHKGLAAGDSLPDLIERYARPAVAALREAGVEKEAKDLELALDVEVHRSRRIPQHVPPHAKDFLISYAPADRAWAEWIGSVLEDAGYTVVLRSWDLRPGSNFVLEMQKAVQQTRQTIVLISPDYLAGEIAQSEWGAALEADARRSERHLLPIRIRETEVSGLAGSVAYLDLVGTDEERARSAILEGVVSSRESVASPEWRGRPDPGTVQVASFPRQRTAVWNLPPRSPGFYGREQILEQLSSSLGSSASESRIAVVGLGGIGKTRLVAEYAERHREEYEIVWQVHAYSPDAARADLGRLAERLGLIDRQHRESTAAARAALGWLADHGEWLLIYDDAVFPRDLGDWLPRGPGHLVITTRLGSWKSEARTLALEPLKTHDSVKLLAGRGADGDQGTVEKLAARLGGQPLALTLAASLACRLGSLDTVLSLLADVSPDRGNRNLVSIEQLLAQFLELPGEEPEAMRLLTLCSLLSANNIPLGWFDDPIPSTDRNSDSESTREAIAVLASYSLLTLQEEKASIHSLVQDAVRVALSPEQSAASLLEVSKLVRRELDRAEWAGQIPPHHHLCHAETVAFRLMEVDAMRPEAARLLDRVGGLRVAREEGTTAVRLLDASIRFWESLDVARPELVSAFDHRAAAHLLQGSVGNARRDLQRALRLSEGALGPAHDLTLYLRERLAQLLMTFLGDVEGAKEHLEAVLESRRTSRGPNHPSTADVLHNLGLAHSSLGDLEKARTDLEQALAVRREALGADHPQVARSLTNLGAIVAAQGDLEQALELQRQALKILERNLGTDHPGLLTVLMNLSGALRHTGRLAEARDILERALQIVISALGESGPDAGDIRYNLAQVLEELGDSAAAQKQYVAVYRALATTAPPDDPRLLELSLKIGP